MSSFNELFSIDETNKDKKISIGSVKLSLRNYLYLNLVKHLTNIDINVIMDGIITDFIDTHKQDIEQLKDANKPNDSDWLVDTLFGK